MTTTSDSPQIALLRRSFDAMVHGDFAVLEDSLAEDAQWRTVDEGPTNCEGRNTIIEVMSRNLGGRLRGSIEQTIQTGPRVIVAFRPEQPSEAANRPLDDGIAYMVVTICDGKIVELYGCADQAAAISYAHAGEAPKPPSTIGVRPPESVVEPPQQRVRKLIPFVHVLDVERSVVFYQRLGFTVRSIFKPADHLLWAALDSQGAELMLTDASDPIDRDRQGVLFYLYSHDLTALREQLIAQGVQVGEIDDGTPGPRQEMRLADPDGYILVVAQIE